MQTSVDHVIAYTVRLDKKQFLADEKTIDAVMRNIEIIGEAANHIPKTVRDRHPDIRWTDIRGMRIILAHAYFRVDPEILWNVIRREIPDLKAKILALREQEGF